MDHAHAVTGSDVLGGRPSARREHDDEKGHDDVTHESPPLCGVENPRLRGGMIG